VSADYGRSEPEAFDADRWRTQVDALAGELTHATTNNNSVVALEIVERAWTSGGSDLVNDVVAETRRRIVAMIGILTATEAEQARTVLATAKLTMLGLVEAGVIR
jgi:hypothetical protein